MLKINQFYKDGFFFLLGVTIYLLYTYKTKTDKVKSKINETLISIGLTEEKASQLTEKLLGMFE